MSFIHTLVARERNARDAQEKTISGIVTRYQNYHRHHHQNDVVYNSYPRTNTDHRLMDALLNVLRGWTMLRMLHNGKVVTDYNVVCRRQTIAEAKAGSRRIFMDRCRAEAEAEGIDQIYDFGDPALAFEEFADYPDYEMADELEDEISFVQKSPILHKTDHSPAAAEASPSTDPASQSQDRPGPAQGSNDCDYDDELEDEISFVQNSSILHKTDHNPVAAEAGPSTDSASQSQAVPGPAQGFNDCDYDVEPEDAVTVSTTCFVQKSPILHKTDHSPAAAEAGPSTDPASQSQAGLGPAQGSNDCDMSSYESIQAMRPGGDALNIGLDTEFTTIDGVRYVISTQSSRIEPADGDWTYHGSPRPNDYLVDTVYTSRTGRPLSFGTWLAHEIMASGAYKALALGKKKGAARSEGVDYRSIHRWLVPVYKSAGGNARHESLSADDIVAKKFDSLEAAIEECCDPEIRAALQTNGRTRVKIIRGVTGQPEFERNINGFPIGYFYDFSVSNSQAIPVNVICHYSLADLTTFVFNGADAHSEYGYEFDLLSLISQVQGGGISLKPLHIYVPVPNTRSRFYPVILRIRDTMAYAPAGYKSLAALGDACGLPKMELPAGREKSKMLDFFREDPVDFYEYASRDAEIAVVYSSELWGSHNALPATVPSAAATAAWKMIGAYYKAAFGSRDTIAERNRYHKGLKKVKGDKFIPFIQRDGVPGYMRKSFYTFLNDDCEEFTHACIKAYHGGFNACSLPGYFKIPTNDFDLCNAYPTAMACVRDVDWEHLREDVVTDVVMQKDETPELVEKYFSDPLAPIVATVDFEFPEDTLYPCIPILSDGAVTYPLTNEGLASTTVMGPELYLALRMGARITFKRLYIARTLVMADGTPSHSLASIVELLVNERAAAKKQGNNLAQLLLKTAVNSLYGKCAQDVICKKTWNADYERMDEIGGSPLTSPYHAAMITAIVRCLLIAAMSQIEGLGGTSFSVTTDGFISDVSLDALNSLDLLGFSEPFRNAREFLTGSREIWESKHEQDELLNLCTRGNVSRDQHGVLAHNSWTPPAGIIKGSAEDRQLFFSECVRRTGPVECDTRRFTQFRALTTRQGREDFLEKIVHRRLSMDFDMKRKPVRESLTAAYCEIGGESYEVACIRTAPYHDDAEYKLYRQAKKRVPCLRTVDDWERYFDVVDALRAKRSLRSVDDGSPEARRRIVDLQWSRLMSAVMAFRLQLPIAAYGNEIVPIPYLASDNTLTAKLAFVNAHCPQGSRKLMTKATWDNARRAERQNQILPEREWIDIYKAMVEAPTPARDAGVRVA